MYFYPLNAYSLKHSFISASQVVLMVKNLGSVPGLGRFPEGWHGNPFQYSCLENPHGQRSLAGYNPWGH